MLCIGYFKKKRTEVETINCSLMRKPFIECSQLTVTASGQDWFVTIRYFVSLNSIDVHWNDPPLNWQKLLVRCFLKMLLENRLTLTYRSHNFLILFVTFWKLIRSHATTPRWLGNAKECIQSGWSKQCDSCSLANKISAADSGRFNSCISWKYLAVSTWGAFLWEDPDQDFWSKIAQIMVYQRNGTLVRRIRYHDNRCEKR